MCWKPEGKTGDGRLSGPCRSRRSADAHDTREEGSRELQQEVMCGTSLVVQWWRGNVSTVGAIHLSRRCPGAITMLIAALNPKQARCPARGDRFYGVLREY